ncbi:ectoine/hydroxyectoine ABC transporter substrate-binding protein EhuB [Marinomonas sp. M1K-6]|uniref:Ectoine/hydroxyectoine ABC transporter substrate-binding protein EhuB n=1 Tax=Marinomonas profundi TaxID=2726122 RepID=A0A847QY04_9GAMM|nr:ectoine/hydroxyectoine ABC transporter substrate-binding protein EhuB [Marinomonas profundi]NLQ18838.1 ectoine/hydroxyectoine ABC transporter substrate-binding protein EhuB [Marinomonas profundi]UDV02957.1 ectoine/hydroxyectoine ABC transporter substrate-binding protein EhuB [Marinomonas profundi]
MNKVFGRYIISLISFSMALFSVAASANTLDKIKDEGTVTIGVANEVPYGYTTADGEPAGEAPSIAVHILNELGVDDVNVVVTEFGSLIPGLRAGRFDVIAAGMYITPKRCEQILFSNPTYSIGEGFLVKNGNPEGLNGYGDIKNKSVKLGVMSGAVEYGYARDFGIDMSKVVTLPDYPSGVAALKSGRIDALAGTSLTMASLGQKDDRVELAQPFEDLMIKGEAIKGYGGFGFRPADTALRDAFNEEIGSFVDTKDHIAMIEPYGFGKHTSPGGMTAKELCQ